MMERRKNKGFWELREIIIWSILYVKINGYSIFFIGFVICWMMILNENIYLLKKYN